MAINLGLQGQLANANPWILVNELKPQIQAAIA